MTKADIVHAVYSTLGGFSKKEAADLVELVFETMKETLGRGEKIKVSGFGNFVLRDKVARQGRNPQSGDPITISARRVLNFKASQLLKQALNTDAALASDVAPAHQGAGHHAAGTGAVRSGVPRAPQQPVLRPPAPFAGGQAPAGHAHPPSPGTFRAPDAAFPGHQPAPGHYRPPVPQQPPPPASQPNQQGGSVAPTGPGQFPPGAAGAFPAPPPESHPRLPEDSRESVPPPHWTPKDGQ